MRRTSFAIALVALAFSKEEVEVRVGGVSVFIQGPLDIGIQRRRNGRRVLNIQEGKRHGDDRRQEEDTYTVRLEDGEPPLRILR